MIILDTNVVSELLDPESDGVVAQWLDSRDTAEINVTAVTVAELRMGVALMPAGRRRTDLNRRIDDMLLGAFEGEAIPFGVEAAGHFADVVASRRRAGRPVMPMDAQIAAICRAYEAQLATRNVRDFEGTGVDVLNPWEREPAAGP